MLYYVHFKVRFTLTEMEYQASFDRTTCLRARNKEIRHRQEIIKRARYAQIRHRSKIEWIQSHVGIHRPVLSPLRRTISAGMPSAASTPTALINLHRTTLFMCPRQQEIEYPNRPVRRIPGVPCLIKQHPTIVQRCARNLRQERVSGVDLAVVDDSRYEESHEDFVRQSVDHLVCY